MYFHTHNTSTFFSNNIRYICIFFSKLIVLQSKFDDGFIFSLFFPLKIVKLTQPSGLGINNIFLSHQINRFGLSAGLSISSWNKINAHINFYEQNW